MTRAEQVEVILDGLYNQATSSRGAGAIRASEAFIRSVAIITKARAIQKPREDEEARTQAQEILEQIKG